MTITIATQHDFTGTYPITVDPRGRITFPREVMRDLEEKVCAVVLGDPNLRMNPYGVQYCGQWLYMCSEETSRREIKEIIDKIKKEDPDAPDIVYKGALLETKLLINPGEEAKKIVTTHWQYYEDGQKREYTTLQLYLNAMMENIRKRQEQESKTEPERVEENIYCSTQKYVMDNQYRICFGTEREIVKEVITGRKLMLLGMQDMLVFITPEQREALQKQEPKFLREQQLVHLVRT